MAKVTLSDLENLNNPVTAVAIINRNNQALRVALEKALFRDGSTPHSMLSDLDMNSYRIRNLPEPVEDSDAVTKEYADGLIGDIANAEANAVAAAASAVSSASSAAAASAFATIAQAAADSADGLAGLASVKDYGALGDGVTDDSRAFIDAVNANGIVVIPETDDFYVLNDMIQIPEGHKVMGLGFPTLLCEVGRKRESTVTLTFSATSGNNITITASAPYFFDDQWSKRDIRVFDSGFSAEPKFVWLGTRVSTTQITGCSVLNGNNFAAGETLSSTGPHVWEYGRAAFDFKSFSQLENVRIVTTLNAHQTRYVNGRWACGLSIGDPWMNYLGDDELKEFIVVRNVHVHGNEQENRVIHGHHAYGWVENCLFENVLVTGKANFAFVNHWTTDAMYNEQAYTTKAWQPCKNTYRNCHAFVNPPFDMPFANAGNDIRIPVPSGQSSPPWWNTVSTGDAVTISSSVSRLPTPLQTGLNYYVIKRPAPYSQSWYCIQLAETNADALAGNAIHLGVMNTGEAGTMTITKVSGGSASQCLMALTKTGRNGFRWSGAAFSTFESCTTDFGEAFEIFPGDRAGYAQNIDPNDTCSGLEYKSCIAYDPDGFGFQCAANGNIGGTYGDIANAGGPNDIWYGNQWGVNSSLSVDNCRVVMSRSSYTRALPFSFAWMNKVTMTDCEVETDNASLSKHGVNVYGVTDFRMDNSYITTRLGALVRNSKMAVFEGSRFSNRAVNYASSSPTAFAVGATERTTSLYSALAVGDTTLRFNQFAVAGSATANMELTTAIPSVAGTGYAVGNVLSVAGGTKTTTATLIVSSIDGSGGITGVTIDVAGVYSAIPTVTNNNNNAVTGGAGTGARIYLRWGVDSVTVTDAGSGMFDAPRVIFVISAGDLSSVIRPSATATLTSTGADEGEGVASIAVTDEGDGMSVIPSIILSDGGMTICPGSIIAYEVTGTATAGASTTLTDGAATWTTNIFTDYIVEITGGTGVGQQRRVASNTGTVLTVNGAWDTNPDATSTYKISGTVQSRGVATQEQAFTNIPLPIWPSRIAIPSGATVKVRAQTNALIVSSCEIEGYSYGIRTAGVVPNRNIKITDNIFRGIGYFNIDLTAAINSHVEGNTFSDVGRLSTTLDTRVIQIGNYAQNIAIRSNTFSDDGKAKFLVYVTSGAKRISIFDNDFLTPNNGEASAAAMFLVNSDNSLWQITEDNNRFGPLVTVKRNGTSVGRYLYDGTVTQGTNKSTGVTLNTRSGAITMNAAALAADTTVSFTLTSTGIDSDDEISVWHSSAGTLGSYMVHAVPGNGAATIYVRNITGGSLSEAIVLKFLIKKRQ